MNPDQFDFIGSDGAFLESDQAAEIVRHQIAWHRAKAMIPYVNFAKAIDGLIAAIWMELEPVLTRLAAELTKLFEALPALGEDGKAADRARSKADVKAKRREMMKRKGRR